MELFERNEHGAANRRAPHQSFRGVIRLEPLMVHFLVTGESSAGCSAAFELTWMGGDRLMAPIATTIIAHSHNHYEERIDGVDGVRTSGTALRLCGHPRASNCFHFLPRYCRRDSFEHSMLLADRRQ